jgi:hypothetical protein
MNSATHTTGKQVVLSEVPCLRCRRQHRRCDRFQPCLRCKLADVECIYAPVERKLQLDESDRVSGKRGTNKPISINPMEVKIARIGDLRTHTTISSTTLTAYVPCMPVERMQILLEYHLDEFTDEKLGFTPTKSELAFMYGVQGMLWLFIHNSFIICATRT